MMRALSFAVGLGIAATFVAAVAGSDDKSRICQYGYAAAQRMSKQESMLKKAELMSAYCGEHGIAECRFGDYQLDHKLSLCLGGTNDKDNLQIQPWDEARKKDQVEKYLCRAVCSGRMELKKAQSELVNNWQGAYGRYIHSH